MTDSERIAALEDRLSQIEQVTQLFRRGTSDDGKVPYLMLDGRLGICTEFWSKQPLGQGAALSVGTANDRYAGYFEVDDASCPDHPTVAILASVVCVNSHGQQNRAIEAHASNADQGNIGLAVHAGFTPKGPIAGRSTSILLMELEGEDQHLAKAIGLSPDGIGLVDGPRRITSWPIAKAAGAAFTFLKPLWP